MHPGYRQRVDKAQTGHAQGRRTDGITARDVARARLYCYAFRTHTIGAFHATLRAVEACSIPDPVGHVHRQRACEQLDDRVNQGMEPVPADFRGVLSTFYRYDRGVRRVLDALAQAHSASPDATVAGIGQRFVQLMESITAGNGLYLTRDTEAPEQAGFVVPNLGITIVPLVYGDHHSWNLAYLTPSHRDVPMHRHHFGVDIHLGFEPLEGYMILGDGKAPVTAGYAMPVPPRTRHGWVNTSPSLHPVPFIFGSRTQDGWGVFFDVEPQPRDLDQLRTVDRTHWQMGATLFLEREIAAMARMSTAQRRTVLPATAMDRTGSGGLELAVSRINASGLSLPVSGFRLVSGVCGQGWVRIGPVEGPVQAHDHFGIPAGMRAFLRQHGREAMVVLDTRIPGVAGDEPSSRRRSRDPGSTIQAGEG